MKSDANRTEDKMGKKPEIPSTDNEIEPLPVPGFIVGNPIVLDDHEILAEERPTSALADALIDIDRRIDELVEVHKLLFVAMRTLLVNTLIRVDGEIVHGGEIALSHSRLSQPAGFHELLDGLDRLAVPSASLGKSLEVALAAATGVQKLLWHCHGRRTSKLEYQLKKDVLDLMRDANDVDGYDFRRSITLWKRIRSKYSERLIEWVHLLELTVYPEHVLATEDVTPSTSSENPPDPDLIVDMKDICVFSQTQKRTVQGWQEKFPLPTPINGETRANGQRLRWLYDETLRAWIKARSGITPPTIEQLATHRRSFK